ncbi:hypothetical protein BUALT_Bualt03G0100600 [Buddleja alternifolia]|uniref:25S rRNA (uridine-N(3))-methyltransferase BMT5-like domain-containing protein n=1 Tax=Buddleja alternifolia TaxID=168488 RepID=A0AAV6XSH7_9LAMI|nr:hypothetical protein BUALT_Bualt03G0100600 [Buddleja alternifolia]
MAVLVQSDPWGREEIWIKHYSSAHNILLVGEGDFSFSLCLAMAFGSATNIVATTLDSYGIYILFFIILFPFSILLFHSIAEISARPPRHWRDHRDITDPTAISPLPIRPTTIPALAWNDGTGMANFNFVEPADDLIEKYSYARRNLAILGMLGASLLHGVDATQLKNHPALSTMRFHRIIYNFPHAGFYGREDDPYVIMRHRNLVRGFFMNARSLLWPDGEIHVSHKITAPFSYWKIEDLATECSLILTEQVDFRIRHYPGYNNKRGSGFRCDEPFPLGYCSTFKFTTGTTTSLRVGFETYMSAVLGRPESGYIDILQQLHHLSIVRSQRLRHMLLLLVDQQLK